MDICVYEFTALFRLDELNVEVCPSILDTFWYKKKVTFSSLSCLLPRPKYWTLKTIRKFTAYLYQ